MTEPESRVEWAVRCRRIRGGGIDTKVPAPSKWGPDYWDRDAAENVRIFAIEEEGYAEAWLISRIVTSTAWTDAGGPRDLVAEADEIRKQVRG